MYYFNRIRIITICLFGIFLSISPYIQAQDPNFHIYLCFGQSNMAGNGTSADLSTQDLTVDSRFQTLRSADCFSGYGKWETAVPPLARCSNVAIGPSDYFGRTMIANLPSQVKVGAVVVAVGGADIGLFHKTNYPTYVASAPNWMKNEINQYGGNPYGRLVALAKEAQKSGVIKGILLHQGESNNNQSDWPAKVKAIYDNLMADLGLDPTKTPLLVGETVNKDQGGACSAHNNQVARMPSFVPNSHVISSSGLPCKSDKLHFTAPSYRTFGERYAQKMLTLIPSVPTININVTNPANNSSYSLGTDITISANASGDNSTISKVDFYEGTTLIGTDVSSPYSVSWTPSATGTKIITAKATDSKNNTATSSAISIKINVPQSPYNGAPHSIPGIIQFEEYDNGGNGLAYYDSSPGSETGNAFRSDDDVDIEDCTDTGGGYNIGYGIAGEWLEYTVDIIADDTYDLDLRVACNGSGRTINVQIGDVIINDITIPNTSGWQNWTTISLNDINLTEGEQKIRVTIGSTNYVNLNYMEFKGIVTSLTKSKSEELVLYPNPTKDIVHFNSSTNWKLLNANGTELANGTNESSIDLTPFPIGLYIIYTEHKVYKVIKE